MSHASTAAKVRRHKEAHPENYCHEPRCLWRVARNGMPDAPCPKHPKPAPPAPAYDRAEIAGMGICPDDGANLTTTTEPHGETLHECPTCGSLYGS